MLAVFEYTYRDETRFADPLRVRRLLLQHTDGRAWTYVRDLAVRKAEKTEIENNQDLSPEQREAHLAINRVESANLEGILATAAVEAFDLPEFDPSDGTGTTELEALTLLQGYMEFAAGKE
jgi:hypothetical protein